MKTNKASWKQRSKVDDGKVKPLTEDMMTDKGCFTDDYLSPNKHKELLQPLLETLKDKRIILASGSIPRRQILADAGLKFEVSLSGFAEGSLDRKEFEGSKEYVAATANFKLEDKMREIYYLNQANEEDWKPVDIVIAADTVISLDDKKIFEKPRDEDHAQEMIRELCDRERHQVYTAVYMAIMSKKEQLPIARGHVIEESTVHFDNLTDDQIKCYVNTGEPFGKAGGLSVSSLAGQDFLKGIDGCYYNVKGFPFPAFVEKLSNLFKFVEEFRPEEKIDYGI